MHNKSPPKLAGKYPPYKNRIPPAPEVSLCLEMACSRVLWSELWLNKSAFSLSATNSVCSVQFFVHDHQEPGYLCPPVTPIRDAHQLIKIPRRSPNPVWGCWQTPRGSREAMARRDFSPCCSHSSVLRWKTTWSQTTTRGMSSGFGV